MPSRFSHRNQVIDHSNYLQDAFRLECSHKTVVHAVSHEPEHAAVQEVARFLLGDNIAYD